MKDIVIKKNTFFKALFKRNLSLSELIMMVQATQ